MSESNAERLVRVETRQEQILNELKEIQDMFAEHKKSEMDYLGSIDSRLKGLENFKVKISGIATGAATLTSVIVTKFSGMFK